MCVLCMYICFYLFLHISFKYLNLNTSILHACIQYLKYTYLSQTYPFLPPALALCCSTILCLHGEKTTFTKLAIFAVAVHNSKMLETHEAGSERLPILIYWFWIEFAWKKFVNRRNDRYYCGDFNIGLRFSPCPLFLLFPVCAKNFLSRQSKVLTLRGDIVKVSLKTSNEQPLTNRDCIMMRILYITWICMCGNYIPILIVRVALQIHRLHFRFVQLLHVKVWKCFKFLLQTFQSRWHGFKIFFFYFHTNTIFI